MAPYAWERREGEQSLAYTAFREYLHLGKDRSLQGAADAVDRSYSLVRRWSTAYEWVERSRAYDSYVFTADTDGLVHDLGTARDESLAITRKLKGHLSDRLDTFIERKEDPTIRWTQALTAMAKVEQNLLLLKDDQKTSEKLDSVMELVEKAVAGARGRAQE